VIRRTADATGRGLTGVQPPDSLRGRTNFELMDPILSKLRDVLLELGSAASPASLTTKLPPERELAARLGVQRSTLRERLAMLEQLGVLKRMQGSGTYVSLPNSEFIRFYFDLALALGLISVEELHVAREALEREIARRAAKMASADDVADLDRLARQMLKATDAQERLEADYQFHMRLAASARNPVISIVIDGLSNVLRRTLYQRHVLVRSVPGAAKRTDASHGPLVEAIRERDPEAALAAMDAHFRIWDEESAKVFSTHLQTVPLVVPEQPSAEPSSLNNRASKARIRRGRATAAHKCPSRVR
jgi:GntR family transcriptional regulator, transcriptional repressor for pyruvate dehydrogenase complex